jgi:hypothetical protein
MESASAGDLGQTIGLRQKCGTDAVSLVEALPRLALELLFIRACRGAIHPISPFC